MRPKRETPDWLTRMPRDRNLRREELAWGIICCCVGLVILAIVAWRVS